MNNAPAKTSWRVGLTGGIGSGKSTVGRMLADRGAALIDADQIARELTAPGGLAMAAIAQAFGPEFVDAKGGLDRSRMREQAFSQPDSRKQLEAIILARLRSCVLRLAHLEAHDLRPLLHGLRHHEYDRFV